MKINKLSTKDISKQIGALPKPKKAGERFEFILYSHIFIVESDVQRDCFKLEWKIIEIK